MSHNKSKQYYDGIYSSGSEEHWEKAPGKDVIIGALQHYFKIGAYPKNAKIIGN